MRIGVIGWYGHGNAGDERILYCLKRFFDGHEFLVTTSFSDAVKRIDELNRCDYVLLGGGGLILRGVNTYTELIERITRPLGCVGLGVEAYHDDNAAFIDALKAKAEFILVRDAESRELLQNHFKVIVSSDLTFLYPLDVVQPAESDTCGVNLRDWYFWKCEHGGEYYKHMMALSRSNPDIEKEYPHSKWEPAKAFDIIKKRFSNLLAVPLCSENSPKADHVVLKPFFENVDEGAFVPGIYNSLRYLVGMRLHSLIFACQSGIPFVSLSYQPKNERFCRVLGLDELSVDIFNLAELDSAISIVKDSYSQLREKLIFASGRAHGDITSTMNEIRKQITGRTTVHGVDLNRQRRHDFDSGGYSSNAPKVSVVLPTYNHLRFLPKAVDSVLAQTFSDFELIIVNDGSTDGTHEYLDTLSDPRIRIIHQDNKRLPEALNAGFRTARGELLTWISADNYCAAIYLEAFVAALDSCRDAGFAYSAYAYIDQDDQVTGTRRDNDVSGHNLLAHNAGTASFMYRRACQEKVGLYDPALEGAEDWDMWLRIIEQFQAVYVPEVLYYYRHHKDSMTERMPQEIRRVGREVFQKALMRRNCQLDMTALYPTLALCKDQQAAKFYAHFDLGTAFLESSFAPAELAAQLLEGACSLRRDSLEAVGNLAIAYGRSAQWEKAIALTRQIAEKPENPKALDLCRAVAEAHRTNNTDTLTGKLLFKVNKESVELFQLEESRKRVYSFSDPDIREEPALPLVSVIIPCYNTSDYLGEAIESVLAQTYGNFEVIVVDDGSTDATPQVVQSFDDKRIRYIYQENKGLAGARNTGIRYSQGCYIAFLDADDYFLPNKLADQVEFLESHPDYGLVAGGHLRIDQNGAVIEECVGRLGRVSPQAQLTGNQFIIHCTLIRRSWIDNIGGFDESLRGSEEWDFHCRLAIAGCAMYRTEDCVCAYRFVPGSLSADIECQLDGARQAVKKIFCSQGLAPELAELMPKVMGFKYVKAAIPSYALGSVDKGCEYLAAALTWDSCLRDNDYQRIINYMTFWFHHVQFDSPSHFIDSIFDNLPAEAEDMLTMREETLHKLIQKSATMKSSSLCVHTAINMDKADKEKIYEGLNKCYFSEQCHEKETIDHLSEILDGVKTFVDIGASLGQYTFYANKYLQDAQMWAIEADPIRFEELERNCSKWELLSTNRIKALFAAASEKDGQETFYVTNSCKSGSLFKREMADASVNWYPTAVNCIRLDNLFNDACPDLVKIDVEGAEMRVLKGATRILQEGKTRFLIEVHSWADPEGQKNPHEITEFMELFGYSKANFYGRNLFVNEEAVAAEVADTSASTEAKGDIPQCMVDGALLPPTLSFEVNNRCNVACIMCDGSQKHINSDPKSPIRRLTAEDLSKKLDGIKHVKSAILSGGYCEPFLNQDLIDVVSILKSKRAHVKVISNGTLINRTMAEKLILAQLDALQISLHGGIKETAEQIMLKASFEQVVSNIRQLAEFKKMFASKLPAIMIIFVGMQRNIRELSGLVALMGEIGAQSVLLKSLMERQAQGLSFLKNESLISCPELLRQEYERAQAVAERCGVHLSANEPYKSIIAGNSTVSVRKNEPAESTSVEAGKTRFCLFPFEQPYVAISGIVGLCCSESGRVVCMGNANDGGLGGVWNNDAYTNLRRALLTGEDLPAYCDNCERAQVVDPIVMQMEIALRQAHRDIEESKLFVRDNLTHYAQYCDAIKSTGGVPIRPICGDEAVLQTP